MDKPHKEPGPDHPIAIAPLGRRVVVRFAGLVVGDSDGALVLKEASYPEVLYFPRADMRMEHFKRTDKSTHCPYKGDASYFSVEAAKAVVENAAWSYEDPYPAMAAIRGHIAFYPDTVEFDA